MAANFPGRLDPRGGGDWLGAPSEGYVLGLLSCRPFVCRPTANGWKFRIFGSPSMYGVRSTDAPKGEGIGGAARTTERGRSTS